jgi:small subunit ribosomal protein S1
MLSERLGRETGRRCVCVNSGSLYRAVTLACLRRSVRPLDGDAVVALSRTLRLGFDGDAVLLDGEDVSALLHSDEIDSFVSQVSANIPLRRRINELIRAMAEKCDVVAEGRDMTTVVFPDAKARFYLDAAPRARAERRFAQGVSGLGVGEIERLITERDALDRDKPEGSLKIADGVTYIDTSLLTLEEVYETVMNKIRLEGLTMDQKLEMEPLDGYDSAEPDANLQSRMQEAYLKALAQLEEGQIVIGTVMQITSDQVFVDVSYKSEGKIPIGEFAEIPKIGDTVSVLLEQKENKYGEVVVSKQKADAKIAWKDIKNAYDRRLPMDARIEKTVKGGFDVKMAGDTHAFMPISQADLERVDDAERMVGQDVHVFIERLYSDGKVNIVVNRRKYLEYLTEQRRNDFFANVKVGAEIEGIVKSFTGFGVFVDLGGFDGLLHANDMTWGRAPRPKEVLKQGQKIKVKVIRIDPVGRHINLSVKHLTDDPWIHFEEKYHVNDIVQGKVTKLADFGAFIELEDGIEGLAHISEFSWLKRIQKPGEYVRPGESVECMILGYDLQAGRVSLGLKQTQPNPWLGVEERYPVGMRMTRKITKVTGSGAYIELEDGVDGFLHSDDLSWIKRVKNPNSKLKEGEDIEFVVINSSSTDRVVRLGVKQLTEDPWKEFAAKYKIGSLVEGEVSSVTDFGVFLKVPCGLEGLIHKSNLSENKDDDPDEVLKARNVGDKMKASIIEMQPSARRLAFSVRDYQKKEERAEISRYMTADGAESSTFTLGDMMRDKEESPAEK